MKLVIEKNPKDRLSFEQRKKRVGRGFVYHESSQPFIKIKVLLKNLEKEPEIYLNKIEKRIYQLPKLINFLRVFEKIKKGKALIHGAGVATKNNQGFLFVGQQDVGKTTLVLLLMKNYDYFIIGDDILELSKDGYLFKVQEKMGIFPHPENLKNIPLSLKEKIIGSIKYHFFKNPPFSHLIYPNLRISYQKLKKVKDKAKLEKIFILEKGKSEIFEIKKEKALRKILSTSLDLVLLEGFPRRLFYNYCWANEISPIFVEKEYEKILNFVLERKKIFLIKGKNPFDFYHLFLKHEGK